MVEVNLDDHDPFAYVEAAKAAFSSFFVEVNSKEDIGKIKELQDNKHLPDLNLKIWLYGDDAFCTAAALEEGYRYVPVCN
jgi:hypothetical protein